MENKIEHAESDASDSDSSSDSSLSVMSTHEDDATSLMDPPKVMGEILLTQLPPEPPLELQDAPEHVQLSMVGVVEKIMESFFVVTAQKGIPALDAGSLLFNAQRKAIGRIFDVFGRVDTPLYSIRKMPFVELALGDVLYFADEYSSTVKVNELAQQRGSDASTFHDLEVPEDEQEFSDDEEEMRSKRLARQKRKQAMPPHSVAVKKIALPVAIVSKSVGKSTMLINPPPAA